MGLHWRSELTRRRFLTAMGAGATYLALTNALGCKPAERAKKSITSTTTSSPHPKHVLAYDSPAATSQSAWAFRSRPDLSPPAVDVVKQSHDTAPGYIFVAPKRGGLGQHGPMIVDDQGQVVWFRAPEGKAPLVMNFKVQHYRGEPVLTWWEGFYGSQGLDEYVILDGSYREITRLRAGNGHPEGDHHEFLISLQNTALITIYNSVRADLSSVGGLHGGWYGKVSSRNSTSRPAGYCSSGIASTTSVSRYCSSGIASTTSVSMRPTRGCRKVPSPALTTSTSTP